MANGFAWSHLGIKGASFLSDRGRAAGPGGWLTRSVVSHSANVPLRWDVAATHGHHSCSSCVCLHRNQGTRVVLAQRGVLPACWSLWIFPRARYHSTFSVPTSHTARISPKLVLGVPSHLVEEPHILELPGDAFKSPGAIASLPVGPPLQGPSISTV